MSEDHLSVETSLSAELTETGVKASAKSRTVAAVDRLFGNLTDLGNAFLERITSRQRATIEGERQLIDAAVKYGIDRMNADDEFARRTFENQFKSIAQQQLNKDAVVVEAIEDLRQNPPSDEAARTGPDAVSEEFMGRFEAYAAGATSEQLRERWGRILAGEIRMPGTFSPKVLRVTDELDAKTAQLFERLMPFRVQDLVVKCLAPQLELQDVLSLTSAGLLVEPGLAGHFNTFTETEFGGKEIWVTKFGRIVVTMGKSASDRRDDLVLGRAKGKPGYAVYILTDVGRALSTILPSNETQVGMNYAKRLKALLGDADVSLLVETEANKYLPASL